MALNLDKFKVYMFEKDFDSVCSMFLESLFSEKPNIKGSLKWLVDTYATNYVDNNNYVMNIIAQCITIVSDMTTESEKSLVNNSEESSNIRGAFCELVCTLAFLDPNKKPYVDYYMSPKVKVKEFVAPPPSSLEESENIIPSYMHSPLKPYITTVEMLKDLCSLWQPVRYNEGNLLLIRDNLSVFMNKYKSYHIEVVDRHFSTIKPAARKDVVWVIWKIIILYCHNEVREPVVTHVMTYLQLYCFNYIKSSKASRINLLLFSLYTIASGASSIITEVTSDRYHMLISQIRNQHDDVFKAMRKTLLQSDSESEDGSEGEQDDDMLTSSSAMVPYEVTRRPKKKSDSRQEPKTYEEEKFDNFLKVMYSFPRNE